MKKFLASLLIVTALTFSSLPSFDNLGVGLTAHAGVIEIGASPNPNPDPTPTPTPTPTPSEPGENGVIEIGALTMFGITVSVIMALL